MKQEGNKEILYDLIERAPFNELLPNEQEIVLDELGSAEEFDEMRKMMLELEEVEAQPEEWSAPTRMRDELMRAHEEKHRPWNFKIWLNGLIGITAGGTAWYRRPALQLGLATSLVVLLGLFFIKNDEVAEKDIVQQTDIKPNEDKSSNNSNGTYTWSEDSEQEVFEENKVATLREKKFENDELAAVEDLKEAKIAVAAGAEKLALENDLKRSYEELGYSTSTALRPEASKDANDFKEDNRLEEVIHFETEDAKSVSFDMDLDKTDSNIHIASPPSGNVYFDDYAFNSTSRNEDAELKQLEGEWAEENGAIAMESMAEEPEDDELGEKDKRDDLSDSPVSTAANEELISILYTCW